MFRYYDKVKIIKGFYKDICGYVVDFIKAEGIGLKDRYLVEAIVCPNEHYINNISFWVNEDELCLIKEKK